MAAERQLIRCESAAQIGQNNEQGKQVKSLEGDSNVVRIYFAFGSAEVSIDQWPQLAMVRGYLETGDARLTLVGHTDNIGSEAVNLSLSRQRAERVKQIFVQDYGVKAERLSIVAKAASQPVTDNDGPVGRALNRRVEFIVEAR